MSLLLSYIAVQLNLDKALLYNSPDFVETLKLQKARELAKQSHEMNGQV